ncbi:AraC family transcriptional regulator [Paenibacillus oryzisoli]|uniref:helix-turn-helix domain-containing protein n=1 Tax=Paenibacillus oryzisoli TaxID=1850517 RepID=UPI003D2CC394
MKFLENVLKNKPFIFSYRNMTEDKSGYTSFHAHPGLEFLYVEQGTGHMIVDNRIMPIKPQTMYMFQPYQLHRVHAEASENQPYVRNILVIDPYVLEPFLSPFGELRGYFHRLWKDALPVQAFEMGGLAPMYELLHTEMQYGSSQKQMEHVALAVLDIVRAVRAVGKDVLDTHKQPIHRNTGLSEQAMAWLERHYQEDFSLSRLAVQLHVSPFYLSRLFKQDTGNTIQEYVTAKRLREACLLLQHTDHSITYIAERVGLTSASYFIHAFKKHIGLTPLQYRKQLK